MRDQRSHEMRWYMERQALKQAQISRSSSAAKALSILRSLNQRAAYTAQHSMEEAMTAELKGLGVPFFGTSLDLVVTDDQQAQAIASAGSRPKWSLLVTETELLDLRRKMVGHLEMLYRD
jgi:hypothetical protein